MPPRSVLLASVLAGLALALPGAAPAKVVVLDGAGHVIGTPVPGDTRGDLVGWTADGAALVVDEGDRAVRVDARTGARTSLGARPGLVAVGPGDRWVSALLDLQRLGTPSATVVLHAADGTPIATATMKLAFAGGLAVTASWANGRVAISTDAEAVVLDTATGAELRRSAVVTAVGGILSADGTALLAARGDALVRVDVATGAEQVLATGEDRRTIPIGRWSRTGRLAISKGARTWLDGTPAPIQVPEETVATLLAPDGGSLLATIRQTVAHGCRPDRGRLVAYAPAAAPVTLVPPFDGEISAVSWSPDGTRIAVDEQLADPADHAPERRGARHPWPKRPIGKDYEMFSARGNRAVRRAVVRFAADLRRGLSREHALDRLGAALDRISKQPWGGEVLDTAVEEAIAAELDPWLHAAGFRGIDATSELEGGDC
jgi:hypothetical protein